MPINASSARNPQRQNAAETPAFVRAWDRRWAGDEMQIPVALSAFHRQPAHSGKTIASPAIHSGARGLWHPRGCGGRGGRGGSVRTLTSSERRPPSSAIAGLRPALPSSVGIQRGRKHHDHPSTEAGSQVSIRNHDLLDMACRVQESAVRSTSSGGVLAPEGA